MAGTYRVTIDVAKIQANVFAMEGGRLSDLAVRNWLRSVGFSPEGDGRTWLAPEDSLGRLDRSEILRTERVPERVAAPLVGASVPPPGGSRRCRPSAVPPTSAAR